MLLLLQRRWRTVLWWLAAATGALLATLPWWLRLWQSAFVQALVAVRARPVHAGTATTCRTGGWSGPRNPLLVALSSAGASALLGWQTVDLFTQMAGAVWLALLVGVGIWAWRRPALRPPTVRTWLAWLLLVSWVVLTALLLQANRLGLRSCSLSA